MEPLSESGWDAVARKGTGCCKWDDAPSLFGSPDVLPLWVADMDFPAPPAAREALARTVEHGVFGYPAARQDGASGAFAGWVSRHCRWEIPAEQIVFAPGVVPSLAAALESVTSPGDGVVVQTPVYHPFLELARSGGRKLVENPLLHADGRWTMDLEGLDRACERAKALLLCSPHNPVGRAWTREELAEVAGICDRHGVIVLADEIHCDLAFPPHRHTPFPLCGHPSAARAPVFMAPSKTFNLAGLNQSIAVIPDPRMREAFVRRFRELGISRTSVPGLSAMEAAYARGDAWLSSLLAHLDANAGFLEEAVRTRLRPLRHSRSEATYLAWIDCRGLGLPDAGLAAFFAESCRVGLNAGRMFGAPGSGWMRLNLATSRGILEEAVRRIEAGLGGLR